MEEIITETAPSKIPGFKKVCFRLGIMMMIIFISRGTENVILSLMQDLFSGLDATESYIIQTVLSFIFLYIIPLICAVLLLKPEKMCRNIYRRPEFFSNAMGMFPAMYGLALMTNLLTMLVSQLFQQTDLYRSFNTVNELKPDSMVNALVLLFQLVVIAPIFEEFWFRGIVLEALRPYGNGFAILVSGLLFGLTHANFSQFFYAFLLGVFFGYIAVSTKSIVTTTIMHACFNSISGLLLLFMSVDEVGDYLMARAAGMKGEQTPVVVVYLIFLFVVIMLMIVGIFMAIAKLRKLKRYKVPTVWTELSAPKRWGIFLSRVTTIIALLLAADTFTLQLIPRTIINLLK
ncbi:MAG: lysostaphin resistance A-like protein [Oscillospiraceae bacterium]